MHRALSGFIDCPRDSRFDWDIDNAGAAVNTMAPGQSIYHDNALYISNYMYYFYFIEGNKNFCHAGLHWQLHYLCCVLKKGRNSKTSSDH